MLDRERILARLDQLDSYLGELRQVLPEDFAVYQRVERKRACERLLSITACSAASVQLCCSVSS